MVESGKLTETLEVWRTVEVQSESGYKHQEEVLHLTTRAERLKNKESYAANADELFHVTEKTFRLRKRDILETDVVRYKDERYRITSINEFPLDNEMVIIISKIND